MRLVFRPVSWRSVGGVNIVVPLFLLAIVHVAAVASTEDELERDGGSSDLLQPPPQGVVDGVHNALDLAESSGTDSGPGAFSTFFVVLFLIVVGIMVLGCVRTCVQGTHSASKVKAAFEREVALLNTGMPANFSSAGATAPRVRNKMAGLSGDDDLRTGGARPTDTGGQGVYKGPQSGTEATSNLLKSPTVQSTRSNTTALPQNGDQIQHTSSPRPHDVPAQVGENSEELIGGDEDEVFDTQASNTFDEHRSMLHSSIFSNLDELESSSSDDDIPSLLESASSSNVNADSKGQRLVSVSPIDPLKSTSPRSLALTNPKPSTPRSSMLMMSDDGGSFHHKRSLSLTGSSLKFHDLPTAKGMGPTQFRHMWANSAQSNAASLKFSPMGVSLPGDSSSICVRVLWWFRQNLRLSVALTIAFIILSFTYIECDVGRLGSLFVRKESPQKFLAVFVSVVNGGWDLVTTFLRTAWTTHANSSSIDPHDQDVHCGDCPDNEAASLNLDSQTVPERQAEFSGGDFSTSWDEPGAAGPNERDGTIESTSPGIRAFIWDFLIVLSLVLSAYIRIFKIEVMYSKHWIVQGEPGRRQPAFFNGTSRAASPKSRVVGAIGLVKSGNREVAPSAIAGTRGDVEAATDQEIQLDTDSYLLYILQQASMKRHTVPEKVAHLKMVISLLAEFSVFTTADRHVLYKSVDHIKDEIISRRQLVRMDRASTLNNLLSVKGAGRGQNLGSGFPTSGARHRKLPSVLRLITSDLDSPQCIGEYSPASPPIPLAVDPFSLFSPKALRATPRTMKNTVQARHPGRRPRSLSHDNWPSPVHAEAASPDGSSTSLRGDFAESMTRHRRHQSLPSLGGSPHNSMPNSFMQMQGDVIGEEATGVTAP